MNSWVDEEFLTPAFFQDPYPLYRLLHERAPVAWSAKANAWLVTPFTAVTGALSDPRLRSGGRISAASEALSAEARSDSGGAIACLASMMAFRDPPDHTRLRKLVSRAFTARRVAQLEEQIHQVVDTLIDDLPRDRPFDLVSRFSFTLPALVICRLLGIPDEYLPDVKRWSAAVVSLVSAGTMTEQSAIAAERAVNEAGAFLDTLVIQRQQMPTDDLLTALVTGEGESMDRDELVAMVILLFFAGFETTEGLIGNGIVALTRNPDRYANLADDPSIAPAVVEEVLRYDNSIQRQSRVASEPVEIEGATIGQGDLLFCMIGAANRDPRRFTDPDTFDPGRADAGNVSFGHGIHFCLGAPLARLEARIALSSMAKQFPGLHLHEAPQYGNLLAIRKPEAVWLSASVEH